MIKPKSERAEPARIKWKTKCGKCNTFFDVYSGNRRLCDKCSKWLKEEEVRLKKESALLKTKTLDVRNNSSSRQKKKT